ncbi:MAG: hypothetical protein ACOC44_10265 [Promethearchaeia archaeon]
MPSFAHVIFALGFSVFLNKVTDGKFTPKHALIFVVNNLFGPDLAGLFVPYDSQLYLFLHGYGWFFMALLLVIPWDILVNRTSWDAERKRPIFFDSEKERIMNMSQVFFLIAAGGIFHLFIDIIGHPSYIAYSGQENFPWGAVWFGGDNFLTIQDIWGTGMFPCGNEFGFWESYLFMYLYAGGIVAVVMFFYAHKSEEKLSKAFIILTLAYLLPLIIFYFIPDYSGFDINANDVKYYGDPNYVPAVYRLVGGEADLGVLVYIFLFFFMPLMLLYYSFNDLPFSTKRKDENSKK